MGSLLAAALTRAQAFLVEPDRVARQPGAEPVTDGGLSAEPCRPGAIDVAVLGMSAGCGVSTVARGLAICLAMPGRRESRVAGFGTAILRSGEDPLAVVRDVEAGDVERAAGVVQAADAVVLVASGTGLPTLAELAASMLEERFGRLLLVANRTSDPGVWKARGAACLPESRLGAALIARGRRPPGALGAALAELAALVEGGSRS